MSSPAQLLEQTLDAHGDTLYRVALLLAGEERAAEALLRTFAAELVARRQAAPLSAPPGEGELLALLLTVAHAAAARPGRFRRAARPVSFGPLPVARLTLEQRFALGLYLLLGYDGARIAGALGSDEGAAHAALVVALDSVGPALGHVLPDRVSGELCLPVRATLVDPAAGSRHGAAVRGHLATCALCRSFDQAWTEITHAAEAQLRATLRPRSLPQPLRARLLAAAAPRRRVSPTLRLALPPLAVAVLIATLILPGFLRAPVQVVERGDAPIIEPLALIDRATERFATPPDRSGIWYGRYQTEWYFDENVYAPLSAEIWLDPRNPARHRLQLTHASGGAPYELQLANGRTQLFYALDYSYSSAIYGNLPTPTRPEAPAILVERLDPVALAQARTERLATGPWSIIPSYLRQARAAPDLRALGRQRDGEQTVQILSFSGVSPLGLPPDAPGATAERVTVLLAIDVQDGLVRSATELAGPAGVEQTSRVTWRIVEQQWLSGGQQIDAAFNIRNAWTGMGDFDELGRHTSADLAVPLVAAGMVAQPAALLSEPLGSAFWLPAQAPAGVDRALLLWSRGAPGSAGLPRGVIYLGPGRRLILTFNRSRPLIGEELRLGAYSATLSAGRTQRYSLLLTRPPDLRFAQAGQIDTSAVVLVDAFGFTRAELLAALEQLRPFDPRSLEGQESLFVGAAGDSEISTRVLQLLASGIVPEGQAITLRGRQFLRQSPTPRPSPDPYEALPYEGRAETMIIEELATASDGPALLQAWRDPASGEPAMRMFLHGEGGWRHVSAFSSVYNFTDNSIPVRYRLPLFAAAAAELLSAPTGSLRQEPLPNGGRLISYSERAVSSPRYGQLLTSRDGGEPYLYDLQPLMIITELQLTPDGAFDELRVLAENRAGRRTLVLSYELLDYSEAPFSGGPAQMPESALVLGNDALPGPNVTAALVTRTLTEALALAPGGLYVPDAQLPLYVEDGDPQRQFVGAGDFLTPAIGRRLAMRLSYPMPALDSGGDYVLRIAQGPAVPLTAYLRATGGIPWQQAEPVRLIVAGRELDGWQGTDGRAYLAAEMDGTLLIAESSRGTFAPQDLALLAALHLVTAAP